MGVGFDLFGGYFWVLCWGGGGVGGVVVLRVVVVVFVVGLVLVMFLGGGLCRGFVCSGLCGVGWW